MFYSWFIVSCMARLFIVIVVYMFNLSRIGCMLVEVMWCRLVDSLIVVSVIMIRNLVVKCSGVCNVIGMKLVECIVEVIRNYRMNYGKMCDSLKLLLLWCFLCIVMVIVSMMYIGMISVVWVSLMMVVKLLVVWL